MKQQTRFTTFLTFLAAILCLSVSLSIESEFYGRFLASILGEDRYLWLPILAAVTVQIARLATSWNSASFAARDLEQQATANLRISGTIALYETVEVTLFGIAYLQPQQAAAFILFGCFFVWVSFALEIILVRSLASHRTESGTVAGIVSNEMESRLEQLERSFETVRSVPSAANGTPRNGKRNGHAPKMERSRVNADNLERNILEEMERRSSNDENTSMQAIADAVGCSKSTVHRILHNAELGQN